MNAGVYSELSIHARRCVLVGAFHDGIPDADRCRVSPFRTSRVHDTIRRMWFISSWQSVARVVVLAACTYVALIIALRLTGSRSLAKMSGYDLVITIALGSLIATIPLQPSIALADGVAAIATYLGLQFLLAWVVRRYPAARSLVKSRPHLVVWNGHLLAEKLDSLNITDSEVRAAIRSSGAASMEEVLAVVLENDGQWSVVRSGAEGRSALLDLEVPPTPSSPAH